ncbi:FAD-dependent monooxygenase [Rhodoplanes sp. Z2-YC6860]|uniref:FAD-dependent monooxygenase n=1 Tax=Rhodoplanes sp. Z2-YC6860 TaxID=674703 RepID=UPI00078BA165|nr:FAD-dependent monooxygenase [Rhodoplanes sp. Z2-YC6860]AMN42280.1 Salicylate hydroxylase [Rhodoplanes sp. Z2-YC6860]
MARRALVIGGSVGGLFAAHLLRKTGWDVAVYERAAASLGDRGTGIGTRPELFAAMRHAGVAADASAGIDVLGRVGLAPNGSVIHERSVRAVTSAWSRIWRPLRQALPDAFYQGNKALIRIELTADNVAAVFADGGRAEAELLVAADGLHSTVRAQLLPDAMPHYAGVVAWRGVVEPHQLAPELHELMFRHMVFGFPDGELMLSIPMPVPQGGSGERCCHFVWFRPADEPALRALCTDATGKAHGLSIPPPLIRPELIEGIKRNATALLAPQLAALVTGTAQIILQPIFDFEAPRIAFGRVALIGDAAFVARPHVASGVMKAALDAESLAGALGAVSDVAAALSRYHADRQPYGAWLVERGRHIGATIASRDIEPGLRSETIMREYGAAGLVRDQAMAARVGS